MRMVATEEVNVARYSSAGRRVLDAGVGSGGTGGKTTDGMGGTGNASKMPVGALGMGRTVGNGASTGIGRINAASAPTTCMQHSLRF